MQTFLPYPNLKLTASCLDRQRLCKQRLESKQIIDTLEGRSQGWKHHPAVKMWKGHVEFLKKYFNSISIEWERRGYKHNMGYYSIDEKKAVPPIWWGNSKFHLSHQSNLVRKKPEHYRKYFPNIPDNLSYFWPKNYE